MRTITNEEFDNRLIEKLEKITGAQLLMDIPSCYEEIAEVFNNEILTEWESEQEEDDA